MTNNAIGNRFLAPLLACVLGCFVLAGIADAGDRGGGCGSGARGGGGHGGGNRGNVNINNSKKDVRVNNVRSTSVNNINVRKNVNVNVDVDRRGCCCNNGWDNDHHPIATAAAVCATSAIVGSIVHSVPPGCVPVNYGGMIYQQCGSAWYQPQGTQYIVVNPPCL